MSDSDSIMRRRFSNPGVGSEVEAEEGDSGVFGGSTAQLQGSTVGPDTGKRGPKLGGDERPIILLKRNGATEAAISDLERCYVIDQNLYPMSYIELMILFFVCNVRSRGPHFSDGNSLHSK